MAFLKLLAGGVQAYGQLYSGAAEQQAANAEAQQREIQAGQERAAAQHNAAKMREEAKRLLSRQRAGAAASGFDATDPTSRALVSDTVKTQTIEEKLVQAQAEDRARQMEFAGAMKRWGGKQARKASKFAAGATLMNAVGDFAMSASQPKAG